MTNETNDITPFRIAIPDAEVDDLHRRLSDTRWPTGPAVDGWSRGIPVDHLRDLAEHWGSGYDWRAHEARLNELPQFTTTIDGQRIHFAHVRSPEPDALPLIVAHGYPSSFAEMAGLVGPLTDPRAHGGDPADAFHLVIPSLPGFGFSTPVSEPGWEVGRTGRAFAELMRRLGYDRYAAHGGDIGAGVTGELAKVDGDHVVATHVNTDPTALALVGGILPDEVDGLSDDESAWLDHWRQYGEEGRGYLEIQTTRPRTLAYGLTDSPVAQLAWIAEKFEEWTGLGGSPGTIDRDELLTTVSIYWFTGSGASAADFIYDAAHAEVDWGAVTDVPSGFAVFAAGPVVRKVLDADHRIEHWSEFAEGGHFPALEVPDLLVGDLRTYFRSFRSHRSGR